MISLISFKLQIFFAPICFIIININQIECLNSNFQVPKKLSNCKAQLDSGDIIDLSPLDNQSAPKYVSNYLK